jgi:hypothetical protein
MVLYGPPGTGKSTIAKEVARALDFPLLTVTPSDFLTGGGEGVEARAKALFQVLAEQRDIVVLFDEIDHLLLDRDSELYREQGDVFKLLTPGMLTKLDVLAKQRTFIFIIATNYFERIDRAIKRPGRIDARYLVLPPDLGQRRRFLAQQIPGWDELASHDREATAQTTVLFTYRELSDLVRQAARRVNTGVPLPEALKASLIASPPMIKLDSYGQRLGFSWKSAELDIHGVSTIEQPWEEVALLAYLVSEAQGWPSDPPWLPYAIKEASDRDAVADGTVASALRRAVKRAQGSNFFDPAEETP